MSGFSSMLSLATVSLSPSSFEISSSAGAIIRHGPHHSAQKSTRTGPWASRTSEAKLWSVTVLVAMAGESPGGGQRVRLIWAMTSSLSKHHFDEFRAGCVQQGRTDPAPREDDLKRLGIGAHLRAVGIGDVTYARRHPPRLEVDHRHARILHENAINGAGDDSPVGQCRGER